MKVLVIHATAGAGHKKAAEAIYNGLQRYTTHEIRIVDSLEYCSPLFRSTYASTYVMMVTKFSFLWGFFFALLDIPVLQPLVRSIRRCYNGINTLPLCKFLKEEKFDVIFTTHFMSAEVCGHLKRNGQINSKIICVVTDFDVHRIWIARGVDVYTGACDFTKTKLIELGIPADKAFSTGIPTDEKFAVPTDKVQMRQALKLQTKPFTVLLATGSFGMGPIEELIRILKDYQVLVVCGHNKELYERLKPKSTDLVHIFGLVNNMHELMSAADVMVTKPGGLSIAEALVKKLPLIFFSAIPGQETGNINVLKKYEAATDQGSLESIAERIDDLSAEPNEYNKLCQKLGALSKPDAVKSIINLI